MNFCRKQKCQNICETQALDHRLGFQDFQFLVNRCVLVFRGVHAAHVTHLKLIILVWCSFMTFLHSSHAATSTTQWSTCMGQSED